MELFESLKILQALADGADPETGEVFPADSPYQRPQVVRALMTAVRALERQQERERRARRLPENAGKSWDREEDEQLCREFDSGISVKDLAAHHGRTEGAIQSRLVKFGKIKLPDTGNQP
jgi:glutathione S-transferase